jgi:protein-arginine kinase activator protein McsA
MPIDYKKYPPNWRSEIVPRVLERAKHRCEKCGLENKTIVYSVKFRGKSMWFNDFDTANAHPKTIESRRNKITGRVELIPNPKTVKVVLTVAHLDHDETNWNVEDSRLMALCQKCHLTYDGYEKFLRRNNLKG